MSVTARLRHVLAGKYRIDQFLGAGGAGLVYAATNLETQERVAVKFLRTERASDAEHKQRFVYEARTAAALHHENAARVMHLDEDANYGLYMVLELLDGEPLDLHLTRVDKLSLEQTCEWLLPIMGMLEHAHARGLLHRDIKPANIFLHEAAPGCITPKLLDFGLARDMHAVGLNTKTGQVVGTPSHMSPEQARGLKGLTAACDVWSMAVVIYRCVTGVEPFERSSATGTTLAVVHGQYTPLPERCPDLPEAAALGRLVDGAFRVDPAARTQTMAELRRQLLAIRAGQRLSLPSPAPPTRPSQPAQPVAKPAGGFDAPRVLLAASALGLGITALWLMSDTDTQAASKQQAPVVVETRVHALRQHKAPAIDAGAAGPRVAQPAQLDPR